MEYVKFMLLGLGSGGAYALLGIGIVLIYRGSSVVNFAHGAIGLIGVAFYYELEPHMSVGFAVALGVLASALFGVLIELVIMRGLRRSSPLMRVVATLAVVAVVEQAALIRYGANALLIQHILPNFRVTFLHGTPQRAIIVSADRLIIVAITIGLAAILYVVYKKTRFGLATTASAENPRVAASLGFSPNMLAIGNWAAGGALAGLAGILLAPLTGLSPTALTLTVLPALAAALLGGFRSFPLTVLGGLLIGVLESEAANKISAPGWGSAMPFIVIMLVLLFRGKALPLRSQLSDRLPKLGTGRLATVPAAVGLVLVVLSVGLFTASWEAAIVTASIAGLITLSLVVIIGYAGQLSLVQYGMAGLGALFSARLADAGHVPFLLACLLGVLLTIPVGALIALPAVRIRGVSLAVVTLGFAVVVNSVVLANTSFTGGTLRGTIVPTPKLFGISLDPIAHGERYAALAVVLFVIACVAVANLRRGRSGRRLIAVRGNERAAASLGVDVIGAKVYAFSLAAALAAVGGVLLAFENSHVVFEGYDPFKSINAILVGVIGGIGFIGGAIIGAIGTPAGPFQELLSHYLTTGDWYVLVTALLTLVALVVNPDGVAAKTSEHVAILRRKLFRRPPRPTAWNVASERHGRVQPRRLTVEHLGVRFGTFAALQDVSLTIDPGKILGLIGPNGAGKTTLIDAVTGFHRHYSGTVSIDGASIDKLSPAQRARKGLTRSFQSLELFEELTVADNLRTASDRRDLFAYVADLVRPGKPRLSPQAVVAVQEFQLGSSLNMLPSELPYATRRLVAIARAVATAPSILMLDEPAAGLDETSTIELGRLIKRLASDWGMSVLLIEHDVDMVLGLCDEVVVLNFGQVLCTGAPEAVRHDDAVLDAYLGTRARRAPAVAAPADENFVTEPLDARSAR